MIKAVIFDWAGTTIDHGCLAPAGAFVAAFADCGVPVSVAEARGPMGLHKKDHLRAMLQAPGLAERWQAARGRPWAEADVEDLYRAVTPLQLAAVGRHARLVEGVVPCVEWLRGRGVRVGATTGYFRAAAEEVARLGREQGYAPDFAIGADEVPAGRPAPWMIFRAMEALDAYPPAAVVKVGDTVADIEDGRNAGAWSVGVIDSSNEMGLSEAEFDALAAEDRTRRRAAVTARLRAAGAHALVRTVAQLPALVGQLEAMLAAGRTPDVVAAEMRATA